MQLSCNWSKRPLIQDSGLPQLKINAIKPCNWSKRLLIQNSELWQLKMNGIKPYYWSRKPLPAIITKII